MWRSACVFRHVYCYVNAKSFGHHCAINFKAAGDGCCSVQKRQLNRRDKYTVEAEKNLSDEDEAAIDDDVSFLVQFVVDFEHTLRVYLFAMCAWISLISGYLGIFISAGICPATATFWYASWYVPSHVIFTSNVSTTLFGEFIYV